MNRGYHAPVMKTYPLRRPASGTFAVITTDTNELVAQTHDGLPLILAPGEYARWLSDEPDPRDLLRPFPAEPLRIWRISTRVNKPENDDPSIVEPLTGTPSVSKMSAVCP